MTRAGAEAVAAVALIDVLVGHTAEPLIDRVLENLAQVRY